MAAPTSFRELRELLQDRLGGLPAAQERVARKVLAEPDECGYRSAGQLARAIGVDKSVLVRFAKSLGLDGYPHLQELCREQLRNQAKLVQRFDDARTLGTSPDDLLAAIADHDQRAIVRTFSQLDREAWSAVVRALAEAPRVHVLGVSKCFSLASMLTYFLRMIRTDTHQLGASGNLLHAEELDELRTDDTLVVISTQRHSVEATHTIAHGHERGLTTILITDGPSSPLVPHATHCLHAVSEGVTILRSVTAFASLIQALATAVSTQLADAARDSLERHDETLARYSS